MNNMFKIKIGKMDNFINRMIGDRGGQITIFVIIAIVIVAAVVGYFIIR